MRDVLVWTTAPLLLRNSLMAADGPDGQRPARADEVKRLGDHPTVIRMRTAGAVAEVAAAGGDAGRALGPYQSTSEAPAAVACEVGAGGPRGDGGCGGVSVTESAASWECPIPNDSATG